MIQEDYKKILKYLNILTLEVFHVFLLNQLLYKFFFHIFSVFYYQVLIKEIFLWVLLFWPKNLKKQKYNKKARKYNYYLNQIDLNRTSMPKQTCWLNFVLWFIVFRLISFSLDYESKLVKERFLLDNLWNLSDERIFGGLFVLLVDYEVN